MTRIDELYDKKFECAIDYIEEYTEKIKEWIDDNIEEGQFYTIDEELHRCAWVVIIRVFEKY